LPLWVFFLLFSLCIFLLINFFLFNLFF
jgi:hypothetical protein